MFYSRAWGRGACEFRELAAALNKVGYRTVAIQPRGIGRSGPIVTDPSYGRFADDVALVLNDIPGGISGGKAHVLGYEFGNRVSRMFAVRYPEHTQSLVLLACGGQKVSPSPSNTKASKPTQSGPGSSKSASRGQCPGTSTQKASSAKAPAPTPSDVTEKIDSFFRDLAAKTVATDPQDVTLSGMIAAFAFWLPPSERRALCQTGFLRTHVKGSLLLDYGMVSGHGLDAAGDGSRPLIIISGLG